MRQNFGELFAGVQQEPDQRGRLQHLTPASEKKGEREAQKILIFNFFLVSFFYIFLIFCQYRHMRHALLSDDPRRRNTASAGVQRWKLKILKYFFFVRFWDKIWGCRTVAPATRGLNSRLVCTFHCKVYSRTVPESIWLIWWQLWFQWQRQQEW